MPESSTQEPTSTKMEEIPLASVIKRIPLHRNPNLPRPYLPDFSDQITYTLLVNLARELRSGDPNYQRLLAVIPSDFKTFRATTAGRHFAGEIPRGEIDNSGNQLLLSLSRTVLDIPTSQPEARLLIAKDAQTNQAVGFINVSTYDLIRDALQKPENPYHFQRLLDILQNPDDRYWQALANQQILPQQTAEQLKSLQNSMMLLPIISPNEIYVNPQHRRQGIATALTTTLYQGAVVVGTTNEPATVNLFRKALLQHNTILAPAVDIEGQPPIAAIALQILPLSIYEQQYRGLVTASSPQQTRFQAFADIQNVARGIFRLNQPDETDPEIRRRDIGYGLQHNLLTSREARLLGITSDVGVTLQYPIISLPK